MPVLLRSSSSGIVPWLTERQSKCPLCKFDVAEYVRHLPVEQSPSGGAGINNSIDHRDDHNWTWNPLRWIRYRTWTAVANEDGRTTSSATMSTTDHNREEVEEGRQTVVIEMAEHSGTYT